MSTFDLDSFLSALSDDAPCGKDLEYDAAFIALETAALGKPEQQIGDSVKEAEPPNWSVVKKDAIQLLQRTRDLRVVQTLTEASLNLDGLPGLYECLKLYTGLLEQFWESVHPKLDPEDDNDPTLRINTLNRLCDFDRMIRPMNKVALIDIKGFGGISLRDVQIASGRIPAPESGAVLSAGAIEAAFRDVEPERLQQSLQVVEGCLDELNKIEQAFTIRLGAQDSPDLSAMQGVLKEIKSVLSKRSGAEIAEMAESDAEGSDRGQADKSSTRTRSGGIQTSRDVVFALEEICEYYRKYEPSSPIPILLNRAKTLVSKNFMEIIKDLAPSGVAEIEVFQVREQEGE